MNIKIKIDGSKYFVCKDCGVYYKSRGGKKNKKICTRCTQKAAAI